MKRFIQFIGWILLVAFLLAPAIAGFYRYGDRRGPRIYPAIYHEIVFRLTYDESTEGKPRVPLFHGRPWFYGMEATWVKPTNPQLFESYQKQRSSAGLPAD